jgi:hypothetical protein
VLRRRQPLLDHPKHPGQIPSDERAGVQPQAMEDPAAEYAVITRLERNVIAPLQHEPVDLVVEGPPHDVLANPAAAINALLFVKVVAGACSGYFDDEFRRAMDEVVVADPRLPAERWVEPQVRVGLREVVEVEDGRPVVADEQACREGSVGSKPRNDVCVRLAMLSCGHG